jgi:hypothetical protein
MVDGAARFKRKAGTSRRVFDWINRSLFSMVWDRTWFAARSHYLHITRAAIMQLPAKKDTEHEYSQNRNS